MVMRPGNNGISEEQRYLWVVDQMCGDNLRFTIHALNVCWLRDVYKYLHKTEGLDMASGMAVLHGHYGY